MARFTNQYSVINCGQVNISAFSIDTKSTLQIWKWCHNQNQHYKFGSDVTIKINVTNLEATSQSKSTLQFWKRCHNQNRRYNFGSDVTIKINVTNLEMTSQSKSTLQIWKRRLWQSKSTLQVWVPVTPQHSCIKRFW